MRIFELYEKLPVFLQNWACGIKGYQLNRLRYGNLYDKSYQGLLSTEKATEDEILNYKEEKIFNILEYSYRHCPFYHQTFKRAGLSPSDFKSLSDLRKFPELTKEDVRISWRGMISDEFSPRMLIPYHTSGSTGKALDFYWTQQSLAFYWAVVWRGRSRCGIRKGDMHLNFTGKLVVPLSQNRPPYWRYNASLHQYMINMQHLTARKIGSIVDFVNDESFRFIVGYPSIIHSFCQLVEDSGLEITNPPLFLFPSAEKLYDYQREQILRVLPNIQIMEHYGFSENAASASKCLNGCYHEDFELGHMELKDAVKTKDGFTGELLATGFHNYGMPFVRYNVGDTLTFSSAKCTCGLSSQMIANIEGRNEDYIITPEGARIMRFDYIFKNAKAIKECQVVQRKCGEIVLVIVRRASYSIDVEKELVNAVHSFISPTLKVNFEYVTEIPRTKAGKFKAVVSELNKNISV